MDKQPDDDLAARNASSHRGEGGDGGLSTAITIMDPHSSVVPGHKIAAAVAVTVVLMLVMVMLATLLCYKRQHARGWLWVRDDPGGGLASTDSKSSLRKRERRGGQSFFGASMTTEGGGVKWPHVRQRTATLELGRFANGDVWRCTSKTSHGGGALDVKFHDPDVHTSIENEVAVLLRLMHSAERASTLSTSSRFGHENVIRVLGYSYTNREGPGFIAYEASDTFSLIDLLQAHRKQHLDSPTQEVPPSSLQTYQMLDFASQIASGMEYLQQSCVVHSNLAARSISVVGSRGSGSVCKIAGFSHAWVDLESRMLRRTSQPFAGNGGGAGGAGGGRGGGGGERPDDWYKWASLETLCRNEHTFESDVWPVKYAPSTTPSTCSRILTGAYGVLLYEIFGCGDVPYPGALHANQLRTFLSDGNRLSVDESTDWPQLARDQMKACWKQNPQERPTFDFMAVIFADAYKTMSCNRDKKRRSVNSVVSIINEPHIYEYQSTIDVLHPQQQQVLERHLHDQHRQQPHQQHTFQAVGEQQQPRPPRRDCISPPTVPLPAIAGCSTSSSPSGGDGSRRMLHAGTPRFGVPMPPTPYTEMPGTPYTEIVTPLPKRQIRSLSANAVWEEDSVPVFASARTPRPSPMSNACHRNGSMLQPHTQDRWNPTATAKVRSRSTLPALLFQSPGDVGRRLRRNKSDASSSGGEGGEDGGADERDSGILRGDAGGGKVGTSGSAIRIHIDSPLSAARPRRLPRDKSWSSMSSCSTSSSGGFAIPPPFNAPLQLNRIFNTISSDIRTQTLL